jgi:hypothetical protein
VQHLLVWNGVDAWRAEVASVDLTPRGLRAEGTQVGVDPAGYRLDYSLDASKDFVTRSLQVRVTGEGWGRTLRLAHDGAGAWRCEADQQGEVELPPAGGNTDAVEGALDCDLGLCPLTNTMPIRRHALHERAGEVDFLMAWISVPDLGLHPSRQRYEHVRTSADGAVVRYVGEHRDFVGELEVDSEALVVFYPDLARRVDPPR